MITQAPFSKEKLFNTIESCNNSLVPGPDRLSQRYLKKIVKNKECTNILIDIANVCIDLGYWPSHFKTSYNLSKSFQHIMLLNTNGKLFEKMIGERIQFFLISNNFIYPYQLDGLKHRFTIDVDVALTHLIRSEQVKDLTMSMLAFNIAQFFSSLNYWLLSLILAKASFDSKVSNFFNNYLVSRKTKHLQNSFSSLFYNVDVGVGQGLALSLILSTLYLSPIFYILENYLKNLKISISILSFVDNSLFIAQYKSISVSNVNLYYSYNVIYFLLIRFGLVIEYGKTEVFHFSRLHDVFNPPFLDLTTFESSVLLPKLCGNIQISSLTKNSHFTIISTSIQIEPSPLSNI